jgi:hypothetical protein
MDRISEQVTGEIRILAFKIRMLTLGQNTQGLDRDTSFTLISNFEHSSYPQCEQVELVFALVGYPRKYERPKQPE